MQTEARPHSSDREQEGTTALAEPVRGGTHARTRTGVEWVLIVAGLGALWLLPHRIFWDGQVRFDGLSELLQSGKLPNMKYSIVGPLFSAPLWYLGSVFQSAMWWCARYNWFVFSLGLLAIYALWRNRIDRGLLRAFLLILIAGSMFANHVQAYYGEVFTTICVAVGLIVATAGTRLRALGGWTVVVLGVVNTPASLVGLGCVAIKRALDRKRFWYGLIVVAAAVLILGEAWIRKGSPFTTGYEKTDPGFTYPFAFGVLSILFSFGKGLVFFTPGIFLPVKRRLLELGAGARQVYETYTLWVAFVVGLVLVYASWWVWDGSWFWGPRFFLMASFAAALPLAVRLRRPSRSLGANLLTLAAFALSIWVSINGAVFDQKLLDACTTNGWRDEYLCDFTPQFSALWHPFVVAAQVGWRHGFVSAYQLGPSQFLFILYAGLVFAYLAFPLMRVIATQVTALGSGVFQSQLKPSLWRI